MACKRYGNLAETRVRSGSKMHATFTTAVDRYVAAAIVNEECTESGDYKRGNRAVDDQMEALKRIRAAGKEGTEALLNLLEHESSSVQLSAAADLVRAGLEQRRATRTLRKIAKGGGHLGFSAENILSEFQKGRLTDPLEGLAHIEEEAARRQAHKSQTVERVHPPVEDILGFARALPVQVPLDEVIELENIDERVGLAERVCGTLFGFGTADLELCPDDDEEPTMAVRLTWAWLVRPDLDQKIAPHADEALREVMAYYRS